MTRSSACLALAIALGTFSARPAPGQVSAFRHDPARVPVGRVYEYLKSNRDGSRPGRVSLYVAAPDRLESLKWEPDDETATLVVAILDWSRFSVARFENWQLRRGRPDVKRPSLETDRDGSGLRVSPLPGRRVAVRAWPWHSYDFDFASLGITLAHLREPERPVTFERIDFTFVGSE